jgi:predicted XRE-type DNA-binding protein
MPAALTTQRSRADTARRPVRSTVAEPFKSQNDGEAPENETVDLGPLNVFEQLGLPDAEERLLKATLVSRIRSVVADRELTQAKAGAIMGLPQPKVSELISGGASGFGAERLLTLLNKLGMSVSIAFHQEPDFAPGETTFLWDRERESDVAPDEEPSEEPAFRF